MSVYINQTDYVRTRVTPIMPSEFFKGRVAGVRTLLPTELPTSIRRSVILDVQDIPMIVVEVLPRAFLLISR